MHYTWPLRVALRAMEAASATATATAVASHLRIIVQEGLESALQPLQLQQPQLPPFYDGQAATAAARTETARLRRDVYCSRQPPLSSGDAVAVAPEHSFSSNSSSQEGSRHQDSSRCRRRCKSRPCTRGSCPSRIGNSSSSNNSNNSNSNNSHRHYHTLPSCRNFSHRCNNNTTNNTSNTYRTCSTSRHPYITNNLCSNLYHPSSAPSHPWP